MSLAPQASEPREQATPDQPTVATPPRFRFSQLLPTLVFDVASPIVVFNVLAHYHVPVLWAVLAGAVAPVLNNLRVWITSRRLEPLGVIVVSFIALGAVAALISGNVVFLLLRDSFQNGTMGVVFLGSLFARRPLMFYIIRPFATGDDPARTAW